MSKNGGAITKLQDKAKRNVLARKMGTIKPLVTRTASTFSEKRVALIEHRERIERGSNPAAAECFRGDGLPDEVIPGSKNWVSAKPPKSNQERAAEDKRNSLRSEWREGFRVQRFERKMNRSERRAAARGE